MMMTTMMTPNNDQGDGDEFPYTQIALGISSFAKECTVLIHTTIYQYVIDLPCYLMQSNVCDPEVSLGINVQSMRHVKTNRNK